MKIEAYHFGHVVVDARGVAVSRAYPTHEEAESYLSRLIQLAAEQRAINERKREEQLGD